MRSNQFSFDFQEEANTWDRFIRNRHEIQNRFLDVLGDVPDGLDPIIEQPPFSRSKLTYKNMLASTLSLNPRPDKWFPQWPVKARSRSCLHMPQMVLDLPGISTRFDNYNYIMDWSSSGYLTVGFPRRVYLWHSSTRRILKMEEKNTSCIKWNIDGTSLFLASKAGSFKFTDAEKEETLTSSIQCPCRQQHCYVTCCAFHPTAPLVFVGCLRGTVTVFHVNKGLHFITHMLHSRQHYWITNIATSSDGGLLAVASVEENVLIYDTTNFALVYSIELTWGTRAIAWHPWKRNFLVLGDADGYMALYDMLEPTNPQATYLPTVKNSILNITFNPISAELVVSQKYVYVIGEAGEVMVHRTGTQLSVLSSFERVVDRMNGHSSCPVLFLSWSPDGTQLATAGTDETAQIWNFFSGNEQGTKKTSCKLNYVSASLELGRQLGFAIR